MISPLQLNKYFFPVISIVANPKFQEEHLDLIPEIDVEINHDVFVSKDDENSFQLKLVIKVASTAEKPVPYEIVLLVIGLFETAPDFPEKNKLVGITGSSILYSAAREYIAMVTGRGPFPSIILPTVSFSQIQKNNNQPQSPPPAKKQRKAKSQ